MGILLKAFQGPAELYAHAIAIEHEASARYVELGQRMLDLGNEQVGELFLRLAKLEIEHEEQLLRRAAGLKLPQLAPGEYAWLDAAAPETAAHELVLRLITPNSALQIALAAERRAEEFFEAASTQVQDPSLAALAAEMAAEEREHMAWVEQVMARTPNSAIDWNQEFA
ncbi:MAG: hypothetical protein A3H35_05085 [Betaproteobacteria bacterium RIFCSPLOWO2_02_FULL_62_17]|nr:MAG: hypothetical protein A3H35_05085 [Betaproteobacteria bacterium RIFCSPLOWO2_02_FULL_62_17]